VYKVKVDEKLLCFTGSVNGMEYVTDPDVKLVVNGVDSFSFAIYPQHPLYREIECKVSRVKIWRDSKLLFYGEVTGYSQDMYGIRTYDCEGALAWLNDLHFAYAISGATPKEVLYWYIKLYNQKLRDKSKSFELGTVTIHKALTQSGTEGTIARSSGVYPSFWEEIQDKLLDSFGGILRVRYVGSDTCAGYIDWLAIPDGTCSQDVRYAKNLLNCDWTYDCTALATAVVPLGKRKDSSGDNDVRLTIDKADDDDATFMIQYMTGTDDLVKSGNMVYSKSRMEKYGLIQQAITFDDITDAGTLAYQGAVWLRQNGKAASTIRAEAIDLADIDESVEHFTHGDYVRTKLPGDSAESLFPITAIEIPIAAPENAKLTVGTQESGITSGSGGQGGGSIADAGSGADALAHTHSNKGVLDKITEQDYADFKGAVNKAHVHANKGTLDKIDETAWLTVYGQSHEHDNKGVLDRITAQDYADFKASANKAHVHDNKSTLDKIDETSWLLVYGQTHIHENQSVLDKTTASYTAAEKTKLAGIAAGAEVNQNAFSTIASGSARYTATSKTAAFVIEGEDGTSVTLSTNGRATISSHSHSNKAVLDATTASYTTAEQTKLKGVSAGAEVNQNAFSTIATGSARYVATAKQSAFLIDGDGGTSVSLDTKTGRLTVSSHTHDNKAVLDQLDEEQWKFINGAANKAHVHDNKGTLDKITDVGWNTVYGYTHSHDNKAVLDKTTASYTAADKKKLDGIDLSKYLPLHGTADQSKALSNGSMRYGWCTNNAENANSGYRWFRIGTMTASKNGFDTETLYLHVCEGYGRYGVLCAYTRVNSTGVGVETMRLSWFSRDSAETRSHFKLVAINSSNGVKFELWCFTSSRYSQTAYYVIADIKLTGGLLNRWVLEVLGESDAKNATTVGTKSVTVDDLSYANTASKANEATTLTDSGWVKCPLAVTGNTTYPTSASTIRVRKYGKMVKLEGWVKYSTAFNTGHNVATIPAGYRPANVMYIIGATNAGAGTKIVFYATIGAGGNIGFSPADQNSSATFNPAVCYEFHATYFID
jgi:hypothetical protein